MPGYEATTTICHRNTPSEQLAEHVKRADIVVSATGQYYYYEGVQISSLLCSNLYLLKVKFTPGGFPSSDRIHKSLKKWLATKQKYEI